MLKKASALIVDHDIKHIICTHLPVESLIVGKKLKEIHKDSISVSAYMLDGLSNGNQSTILPYWFSRYKKSLWEDNLLNDMDSIYLMKSSQD